MTERTVQLNSKMPAYYALTTKAGNGGWLTDHPACYALWYYNALITKQLEQKKETIYYEDEQWAQFAEHTKSVFLGCAKAYAVDPDLMLKFWLHVRMQVRAMGGTVIPEEYQYASVPEIK